MEATVKQVENGFIITTTDGRVFVANRTDSYSYKDFTVVEVLKSLFDPKTVELVEAA